MVHYTAKQSQTVTFVNGDQNKTYGDGKFTNTAASSVNATIKYSSNNTDVATVNESTGEVTVVGYGTATITATAKDTETHAGATATYTVNVAKKGLTVTADDVTLVKGATLPTDFTFKTSGLVGTDTFTNPIITTNATDTNSVGEYDITITSGSGTLTNAESYTITYVNGKLDVVNQLYDVTVTNGTTDKANASDGDTVTVTADNRSGYTFTGWSGADVTFANSKATVTTFTMPNKAVAITANYRQNSNGGGSSSGGGDGSSSNNDDNKPTVTPTTPTPTNPKPATEVTATIKPTVSNGTLTATVSKVTVDNIIKAAQAEAKKNGTTANGIVITLKVDGASNDAANLSFNLLKTVVDSLVKANVKELHIKSEIVDIRLNLNTLKEIQKQVDADVNVSAKKVDNKTLPAEAQKLVGNRPVYDFSITGANSKKVINFGNGKVSVSIPYTLRANENAANVVAYYIDSTGKTQEMTNPVYDPITQILSFVTDHFSQFAVGYKNDNSELAAGEGIEENITNLNISHNGTPCFILSALLILTIIFYKKLKNIKLKNKPKDHNI